MAANNQLVEIATRHQVYLERLKAGEVKQFSPFLKQMRDALVARLHTDITSFNRSRIERLITQIERDLASIFTEYHNELQGSLLDISEYESGFEQRSLSNVVDIETVLPAAAQVRAAVLSTPLSVRGADGGKLLESFISDWASVEKKRLTGAIRQGFFEGQTNNQIINNVKAQLGVTERNAEAIVRTAVQHVASTARMETLKENGDISKGYRWVSTLDLHTSTQCKSLDNQVFKHGKGPIPPIHIRCRSTTIAELADKYAFLSEGRTRASIDGPIPANTNYYDWLKEQPESFQNDALGKARAQLFRDGGLSSKEFARLNLGRNFKPLTLDEMRKREPAVFEQAFED